MWKERQRPSRKVCWSRCWLWWHRSPPWPNNSRLSIIPIGRLLSSSCFYWRASIKWWLIPGLRLRLRRSRRSWSLIWVCCRNLLSRVRSLICLSSRVRIVRKRRSSRLSWSLSSGSMWRRMRRLTCQSGRLCVWHAGRARSSDCWQKNCLILLKLISSRSPRSTK